MKTYNTAMICEEAHALTVKECKKKKIALDCPSELVCGDKYNHDDEIVHYSPDAQDIFDRHFDAIEARFEADQNYKREE